MNYYMDENTTPQTEAPQKSNTMVLIIVVVVIAILGGAFFVLSSNKTQQSAQQAQVQPTPIDSGPTTATSAEPSAAVSAAPSGAMKEGNTLTVDVTAKNFSFTPTEIRAKQGDKVTINFTNSQGFHDFVIDEYNVKTDTIGAGKTAVVTFTADKKGTFAYYCNVGNHRAMGMEGKLIVE